MNTRKLVIRPEATEDVTDGHDYYLERGAVLGTRFLQRVNEAITRIQDSPELYGKIWRDVRAKRLKKFPFIVYYQLHDSFLEIVAVLHGSRDASVWQSRV